MNNNKAIVVFSGGQDSTTCLLWAQKKFDQVETLSFDYGQRHDRELHHAAEIAESLDVPHKVMDLSMLGQLTENALTRDDIEIEEGEKYPTTFVDGRNHLFLLMAGIYAKQVDAKHIITGVCETDYSGYPDCRDAFVKSMNVTLNLSMDEDFVIHTPLMFLNKAETWKMADELGGLDFVRYNTLTCYEGIVGDGCGECPACKLRGRGLNEYLAEKQAADDPEGGNSDELQS
ncbi:7-cyano-7-deazaguanine synthase QueC [Alteribacter lacisalsi]|uniref:7-cyano-7-deazaguanine synthase n=1 Tax=Alteribacter lacisalsi TaxID=2045244 RepID=A0A2W0H9X0_9BACI|nr:7-cyano-7-deazaguanine synthase QueC [Alteribacter lacisalsi]PYZ96850.1 7-cyano-7-deazaguanine synthase QueC [Alteribacter lacisalsi]